MRIVQITPGSGDNFYCENCLRDRALVGALRALGHDVILVPFYLPLQSQDEPPLTEVPIFYGGVNVYLQQKLALFRKTPRWLDKLFDCRALLDWAGRKVGMTSAKDLGETTLSMLRGREGRQIKELERFLDWLDADENRPDVVMISNVLLSGLVPAIKERLEVPVFCLLQDEDGFVDGLASPYAEQAWELMRRSAREVDGFLAVSEFYDRLMAQRLKIPRSKRHCLPIGIPIHEYSPAPESPAVPTIGFLSRLCAEKGLDRLVDAFILIKSEPQLAHARLRISGGRLRSDEPLIRRLQQRLEKAGCLDDVTFSGEFSFSARLRFLQDLTVLTVPEKSPVAYGLYVLEALACAVPVVQPAIGVFPELIAHTQGGLLYEGTSAIDLAQALKPLLLDNEKARRLGQKGLQGVRLHYDIQRTAERIMAIIESR